MTLPVEVVKGRAKPTTEYSPSEITLYGTPLDHLDSWIGAANDIEKVAISIAALPTTVAAQANAVTSPYKSALIIAFAYQGHCYNLPEPMIIFVEGLGSPAHGYDFDGSGYAMWPVEKLDRTTLLEPTSDTLEEIILKRTMMGAKQPISYATHVAISHRGGKLSE